MKSFPALAASAALVVTSFTGLVATPASAQWGYDPYYYRRDRGVSIGDVLTGVLIVGTVVTIASHIGKNNRRDDDRRERERTRGEDRDWRDGRYDDRRGDGPRYQPRDRHDEGAPAANRSMNDAVDRCLERARNPGASVESVQRRGTGWEVSGMMDPDAASPLRYVCEVAGDGAIVRFQNIGARPN